MIDNDRLEDAATCERAQLPRTEVAAQLVREVMVARPKTLSGDATVAAARAFFANPKVVTAVLVDGAAFAGILDRSDLPVSAPDAAPVRGYARRDVVTTTPSRPMRDALTALDTRSLSRLVVLEDDGVTLAGLLCLDLNRAGFCQD